MVENEGAVVGSIVYVPDSGFHATVERRGADGGSTETARFSQHDKALLWLRATFTGELEAWREDQRLFEELKQHASPADQVVYFAPRPEMLSEADKKIRRRSEALKARIKQIGEHAFRFVSLIEPERDRNGTIREFLPQDRYRNEQELPLHQYGHGPFCRFRIPNDLNAAGVYAITVGEEIVYIGECQNLSRRFNSPGYGTISPRNCFRGGQQTNCRMNNLILQLASTGQMIELWFLETANRKAVERKLIQRSQPKWNIGR